MVHRKREREGERERELTFGSLLHEGTLEQQSRSGMSGGDLGWPWPRGLAGLMAWQKSAR